jgi:hypothetical protein
MRIALALATLFALATLRGLCVWLRGVCRKAA